MKNENNIDLAIDINKSLIECPPMELEIPDFIKKRYPDLESPKWIERKVLNWSEIIAPTHEQMRALALVEKNIKKIQDDIEANGFRYDKAPCVINEKKVLKLGYHRRASCYRLNITSYIFDIYDFHGSEILEKVFSGRQEGTDAPREEHTMADHLKDIMQLCNKTDVLFAKDASAMEKKEAVSDYINWAYEHKTKDYRTRLKKKVSASLGGYHTTLRTYHSGYGEYSTRNFAKKHNIGYAGLGNYGEGKTDEIAYITSDTTPKTGLLDALTLYYSDDCKEYRESGKKILFYFYIDNPSSIEGLNKSRVNKLKGFKKFVENSILRYIKSTSNKSMEELWESFPIVPAGFLAQNETPRLKAGGGPTEYGVLDPENFLRQGKETLTTNVLKFAKETA